MRRQDNWRVAPAYFVPRSGTASRCGALPTFVAKIASTLSPLSFASDGSNVPQASISTCSDAEQSTVSDGGSGGATMPSVDAIVERIRAGQIKRIVVMAGAGISVAAGIPDFRSADFGLYSRLGRFELPRPEAMFHIDYFRMNPRPFYCLAKELMPGSYAPTNAHFFGVLLQRKKLLHRFYTQNVDNLELLAGVTKEKVVEAHGSFRDVHCIECGQQYSIRWFREALLANTIPRCARRLAPSVGVDADGPHPPTFQAERGEGESREKTEGEPGYENLVVADSAAALATGRLPTVLNPVAGRCGGLIKPDIVFFGEGLPERFMLLSHSDLASADLLIIMGTSLQVYPFAGLVGLVNPHCPRLLINRELVGLTTSGGDLMCGLERNTRDVFLQGDCEDGIRLLCRKLGWETELDDLRRQFAMTTQTERWAVIDEVQKITVESAGDKKLDV